MNICACGSKPLVMRLGKWRSVECKCGARTGGFRDGRLARDAWDAGNLEVPPQPTENPVKDGNSVGENE